MTLPTNHPYFFTCPSCGCKLISVSSGVRAKPHCPAETVKNEIASDDDAYAHIGFHLANDIRNQSPASEVLLTLCGWNINTLLDKTPPIAIRE